MAAAPFRGDAGAGAVVEPAVAAATPEPGGLSDLWDERVQQWRHLIEAEAPKYNLDPNLVAAVMLVESGGNPRAVSSAGARGLMQVMPYHPTRFANRPSVASLLDPGANVAWGCAILRQYIDIFDGDVFKGLGAYYAGSKAVREGSAEAKWYAQVVLATHKKYTRG